MSRVLHSAARFWQWWTATPSSTPRCSPTTPPQRAALSTPGSTTQWPPHTPSTWMSCAEWLTVPTYPFQRCQPMLEAINCCRSCNSFADNVILSYSESFMAKFKAVRKPCMVFSVFRMLSLSCQLFLWNMMFEWEMMLESNKDLPTPACSDLYLTSDNRTVRDPW